MPTKSIEIPIAIQITIAKHGAFYVEAILKSIRDHLPKEDPDRLQDGIAKSCLESSVASIAMSFMGVLSGLSIESNDIDKEKLTALTEAFLGACIRNVGNSEWKICR